MTSKTPPKLTIIIPTYNVGKYIDQALSSVLSQTIEDIEIICIDDGSSDDTVHVIEDRRRKDSRIKLFHQEHQGAGPARNLGLQEAHGTFVAFLDGDDFYLDKDALARMYDAAIEQGADICAAHRKICYPNRVEDAGYFLEFGCKSSTITWVEFKDYQQDWYFQDYIFRKKFLERNKIVFPPYLRYQDPPFLLKTMVHVNRFLLVSVYLYCYRQAHKALQMKELQVCHMLRGIYDNLLLSSQYGYNRLYDLLIERLNGIYYAQIASNLSPMVLQELLNIDAFHHKVFPDRPALELLDTVKTAVQDLQYEQYIFPYHLLKDGKRILLYGASYVGKALYYQFRKYGAGCGEIVGIIDRDTSGCVSEGVHIISVEQVSNVDFDVIILATEKKRVADDMKKILFLHGISDDKILWDENGYRKKNYYESIAMRINF